LWRYTDPAMIMITGITTSPRCGRKSTSGMS
jgi:hypothetical protein